MESVGFKEWAVVCEALGCGRQNVILRKGGIAEGRAGFSFRYREFFLFPTWFHEQPQKVREVGISIPEQRDGVVEIKYAASIETTSSVASWDVIEALEPFHILQPDVIRERFMYDGAAKPQLNADHRPAKGQEQRTALLHQPALQVAFVRIYRLEPAWTFPNEKKFGGCRSWVKLPAPSNDLKLDPVLSDAEHAKRKQDFLKVVRPTAQL